VNAQYTPGNALHNDEKTSSASVLRNDDEPYSADDLKEMKEEWERGLSGAWLLDGMFGDVYEEDQSQLEAAYDAGLKNPFEARWKVILAAVTAVYADYASKPAQQALAAAEGLKAIEAGGAPSGGALEMQLRYHQARAAFRNGDILSSTGPALRYADLAAGSQPSSRLVQDHQIYTQLGYIYGLAIDNPWLLSLSGDLPASLRSGLSQKRDMFTERASATARMLGYGLSPFALALPGGGSVIADMRPEQAYSFYGKLAPREVNLFNLVPPLFAALEADFPASSLRASQTPRDLDERLSWVGQCLEAAGTATAAGDFATARIANKAAISLFDDEFAKTLAAYAIDEVQVEMLEGEERYEVEDRIYAFQESMLNFGDRYFRNPYGRNVQVLPVLSVVTALEPGTADHLLKTVALTAPVAAREFVSRADRVPEIKKSFTDRGQKWSEAKADMLAAFEIVPISISGLRALNAADFAALRSANSRMDDAIGPAFDAVYRLSCGGDRIGSEEVCGEFDRKIGATGKVSVWEAAKKLALAINANSLAQTEYRAGDGRSLARAGALSNERGNDFAEALGAGAGWRAKLQAKNDRALIEGGLLLTASVVGSLSDVSEDREFSYVNAALQPAGPLRDAAMRDFDGDDRETVALIELARDVLVDALTGLALETPADQTATVARYRSIFAKLNALTAEHPDWRESDGLHWIRLAELLETLDRNPVYSKLAKAIGNQFVAQTSVIVQLLRENGGAAETAFAGDFLLAVFRDLPDTAEDLKRLNLDLKQAEYLWRAAIPLANALDRPVLAYDASRSLSVLKSFEPERVGQRTATEGFRFGRETFGTELRLLTTRLNTTSPVEDFDRAVALMDLVNRSAAGSDLSERLEMQQAPEAVRRAYSRYIVAKLQSESLAGLRQITAAVGFKEINTKTRAATAPIERKALEELLKSSRSPDQEEEIRWTAWQDAMRAAGLSRPPAVSVSSLSASLKPGELLVTGVAFTDGALMMAVTDAGLQKLWYAGEAGSQLTYDDIDGLRNRYRASLTVLAGGQLPRPDIDVSRRLYTGLFGAIDAEMAGATRIVWVPPRNLDDFPLAGLVRQGSDAASARYLGLEKELMTVPSLASFVALRAPGRNRETTDGSSLVVGDINFSGRAVSTASAAASAQIQDLNKLLGRLEGAKPTLEALQRLLPSAIVLKREDATRRNVLSRAAQRYRSLVFYTHGVGADVTRGCSATSLQALALHQSGSDASCADALLTAEDVVANRLRADLVVLAACRTGAAPSATEDALAGLARAFLISGSEAVVTAQFDVLDSSASQITQRLIAGVEQNAVGPSAAMQRAMLTLAQDAATADPVHWAQFEVVGEGGRPD
jgi:CHAT domain-containing protein